MIRSPHRIGSAALVLLSACSFDRGGLYPNDALSQHDLLSLDAPALDARDDADAASADLLDGPAGDLPSVPWFNSDWDYRKRITVSAAMVAGGNHTDFPLLLTRDADLDLATHADQDGDDLIFVLPGGTAKLDHELERFDKQSGALVAWVRLPTLAAGADTVLLLYYGKGITVSQQDPEGVWSGFYEAVWHLGTDPAKWQVDSTGNNHNGNPRGGPNMAVGKAGFAISFDGTDDAIDITGLDVVAGAAGTNGLTLEAWVFARSLTGRVVSKASGLDTSEHYWMLALGANPNPPGTLDFRLQTDSDAVWAKSQGGLSVIKQWMHLAATYDGSQMRIYKNGAKVHEQPLTGTIATSGSVKTSIGDNPEGDRYLDGILDEVRISTVARSVDWLKTQHNNQDTPASYVTFGGEESRQ